MSRVVITSAPIDAATWHARLRDVACGACVTFEGWVRNHQQGRAVRALEYEVYRPLAVSEGEKILAEAAGRHPCDHALCVHREGHLDLGEIAVWVGVSAAHRDEAFRAARYIIDELKVRLPIWKKEHYVDGESAWVNCQRCAEHAEGGRG